MRVIELFSGIGACSVALKRLGIDLEIVDSVEIDKYCVASFNAIHGTNFEVQDILTYNKTFEDIDLITHGSPCQDFSVAGKQAGGDLGSGTRSSLMYETIRIVGQIRPKYVLWENVKNLLSAKHKHNFDAYIETMRTLGYNSYYKVLNAKDYGIPQNRERVYTISIRKDIDKGNFKFPEKEELKLRLKDMLEDEVDEKYYLDDTKIKKITNSNFMQEKKRIQDKEYCDTLLARDWKDPKCVQVAQIYGTEREPNPQAGRVYDSSGLSPTMDTCSGGNRMPKIIEPFIVASRGRNPENTSSRVAGEHTEQRLEPNTKGTSNCISTVQKDNWVVEPKLIAHNIPQKVRVRKYPVNIPLLQSYLRNRKHNLGYTNKDIAEKLDVPITTVEHWFRTDNCFSIPEPDVWLKIKDVMCFNTDMFDESIMTFEEKDNVFEKADRVYDEQGISPTLMQGEQKILVNDKLPGAYGRNFGSKGKLQDVESSCDTLQAAMGNGGGNIPILKENINYRIRKLTPKECWRLMGFTDEDFEKAQNIPTSNTQLYKQARKFNLCTSFRKDFLSVVF